MASACSRSIAKLLPTRTRPRFHTALICLRFSSGPVAALGSMQKSDGLHRGGQGLMEGDNFSIVQAVERASINIKVGRRPDTDQLDAFVSRRHGHNGATRQMRTKLSDDHRRDLRIAFWRSDFFCFRCHDLHPEVPRPVISWVQTIELSNPNVPIPRRQARLLMVFRSAAGTPCISGFVNSQRTVMRQRSAANKRWAMVVSTIGRSVMSADIAWAVP